MLTNFIVFIIHWRSFFKMLYHFIVLYFHCLSFTFIYCNFINFNLYKYFSYFFNSRILSSGVRKRPPGTCALQQSYFGSGPLFKGPPLYIPLQDFFPQSNSPWEPKRTWLPCANAHNSSLFFKSDPWFLCVLSFFYLEEGCKLARWETYA